MPKFHKEILTDEQEKYLPLVKFFSRDFGLVGGTAIALYLGHRQSIDFDLFSLREFDNLKIRKQIISFQKIDHILRDEAGQYTVALGAVRLTFFYYPFPLHFSENFDNVIKLPDLLTLAAMKAHALGRRAKWKDYVDLFFVMEKHYSIEQIIKKAKQIFFSEFNEKIFKVQLAYFKDIDYTEEVIFMKGFDVDDKTIKEGLVKHSLK